MSLMKKIIRILGLVTLLYIVVIANAESNVSTTVQELRSSFCVVNKGQTCNTTTEYLCAAKLDIKEWATECSDENSHACLCAGALHEQNHNMNDAIKLYQQTCDLDGRGCYALGNIYRSKILSEKNYIDEITAFQLYRLSCQRGYLYGCHAQADVFGKTRLSTGLMNNMNRNDYEKILQKNCDSNVVVSCDLLKKYYKMLMGVAEDSYERLYNTNNDFEKLKTSRQSVSYYGLMAADISNKLCEEFDDAGSCYEFGAFYLSEIAADEKEKKSEEFSKKLELQRQTKLEQVMTKLKQGSEVKIPEAVKDPKDDARSELIVKAFQRACELSSKGSVGCFKLGQLYLLGEIVEKDYIKAEKYFDTACGMERSKGERRCELMVKFFKEASVDYLRKACDLGDANSCIKAAGLHVIKYGASFRSIKSEYGSAAFRSSYSAISLYRKACELQSGEGCFKEGMFYIVPDAPLSFDYTVIEKYYTYGFERLKKACDYQYAKACDQLAVFKKDHNLLRYFQ